MRYSVLAVILVLSAGIQAQSSRTLSEFDPGMTVAFDLSKKLRLDFAFGREKTDELSAAKWKVAGGFSIRIKPLRKTLFDLIDTDRQHRFVVGAMYEYSKADEAGVEHIEHKVMLDGTFRNSLPGRFLLTHRSRVELRWLDNDFHWRYRDRLFLEKNLRTGRFRLTPFGGAEAVWDTRYNKFNIFKFTGGITFPLVRRSTLDVIYERQLCTTCTDHNTNIVGVTLNLYLVKKR